MRVQAEKAEAWGAVPPRPPAGVVFSPPQGREGFLEAQEASWTGRAGDPRLPHLQGSLGGPLPSALHLAAAVPVQAEGPLSPVSLPRCTPGKEGAERLRGEQVGALSPVVTEEQRAGI